MYELYQLAQEWQRLCLKQFEPLFDNPIAEWYMNSLIDASLRVWFWPGAFITLQDQMEEWAKSFSICR